jgi:hypothetical protein
VSKTELSGAVSVCARNCALWNRTSSSTFSLCFFDIRPNFTAVTIQLQMAMSHISLSDNFTQMNEIYKQEIIIQN